MRILLVEDDPMIGDVIASSLKDASYAVDWVRDGLGVPAALAAQHYDLALLDLGLPGRDGLDVLRSVRGQRHAVPVIIITARDAVAKRVAGLDGGADDYLLKPFEMSELLARMRAVVRRHAGAASPMLSNGALWLDPATHEAGAEHLLTVMLSHREFALLHALLRRPGAILSRRELEDRIYGWGEEVESNAVEFLIHALRKKLGAEAIKNVRGAGWMVAKPG
jgi:two-component system OmpR family response regulator